MSKKTFEVTSVEGYKFTINAQHVIAVAHNPEENATYIYMSDCDTLRVEEQSYRSIRGYLNKALANGSDDE